MSTLHVSMDESGTLTFLVNDDTAGLLNESSVVRRASHVEPVSHVLRAVFHALRHRFGEKGHVASFTRLWPCLWQINLAPIGGPVLEVTYRNRQAAIDAEITWLNENLI